MSIKDNDLIWENDRWGGWLACKWKGDVRLLWWDVVTNQGYNSEACALVQLIVQNR